jgi:hypothetical protein
MPQRQSGQFSGAVPAAAASSIQIDIPKQKSE